jgi:hypothetical protein
VGLEGNNLKVSVLGASPMLSAACQFPRHLRESKSCRELDWQPPRWFSPLWPLYFAFRAALDNLSMLWTYADVSSPRGTFSPVPAASTEVLNPPAPRRQIVGKKRARLRQVPATVKIPDLSGRGGLFIWVDTPRWPVIPSGSVFALALRGSDLPRLELTAKAALSKVAGFRRRQ